MSSRGGRTHYEVLGVAPDATVDDLHTAFRQRVRALHPDLHPTWSAAERAAAEEELKALVAAWKVLRDPEARATYDAAESLGRPPGSAPADDVAHKRAVWFDALRLELEQTLPDGFELYGTFFPKWDVDSKNRRPWRSSPDDLADVLRGAVSVQAAQPDLAPLRSYAPDKLWRLRAESLPVTDADVAHLAPITSLEEVLLAYTNVGDGGLRVLGALPRLRVLDLWRTRVTDAGLANLADTVTLDVLNLGRTAVTDAGLVHLSALHGLAELNLRGTRVRGPGLAHLHGLASLRSLALPALIPRAHKRALREACPKLELL